MAKESMKAREVKRAKLCAKYAEKRKALKEAGDHYRTSQGIYACFRHQPYSVPRDGQQGFNTWSKKSILVKCFLQAVFCVLLL